MGFNNFPFALQFRSDPEIGTRLIKFYGKPCYQASGITYYVNFNGFTKVI